MIAADLSAQALEYLAEIIELQEVIKELREENKAMKGEIRKIKYSIEREIKYSTDREVRYSPGMKPADSTTSHDELAWRSLAGPSPGSPGVLHCLNRRYPAWSKIL